MLTLARFPESGAAGHLVSIDVKPEPGCYLLLQSNAGDIALYLGFREDGTLEFNTRVAGTWGLAAILPSSAAKGGATGNVLRLDLGILGDHVEVALDGVPQHVARLGVRSAQLRSIEAAGEWQEARLQPGALPDARLAGLRDEVPGEAASDPGRIAVVAAVAPEAAIADALAAVDTVVALVPAPALAAALVSVFRREVCEGRLQILRAALVASEQPMAGRILADRIDLWLPQEDAGPAAGKGWDWTVPGVSIGAVASAFGVPERLYAEAGPDVGVPRFAAVPAGSEAACRMLATGATGLRLLRATPCGPRWGRTPVLQAAVLSRLLVAEELRGLLEGMVLLGPMEAAQPTTSARD